MCSTIDTTFKFQTIISLQAINLVSFSFTEGKLNNCFLMVIYLKVASQHRYQLVNNKYFCPIFKCSVWIFLMWCHRFSFSGNAPLSGKSTSAVSSSTEDENTGRKKSVLGLYLNAYGVLFIQRYSKVSLAYHSLCTACPFPPAMGWLLDFCGKGEGWSFQINTDLKLFKLFNGLLYRAAGRSIYPHYGGWGRELVFI